MSYTTTKMKNLLVAIITISCSLIASYAQGQFVTTWKTDNPGSSNNNQITIPTFGAGYNYTVDWGDSSSDTGVAGNITHTYASPGIYTVTITGSFPSIYFNGGGFFGDNTDFEKILTVESWGTNAWTSMANAFSGCLNLRINAIDTPDLTGVTDMTYMFRECAALNDNIDSWNISNVTNLTGVFREATSFNQPLNSWDVSSVTIMRELFRDANAFNQPLNTWDVVGVTDMGELFFFASSFNQNIGMWKVNNVNNMGLMFGGATVFNQDISYKAGGANDGTDAWNTANVTTMDQMFASAENFNQNISNWNTNSVTIIRSMFSGALAFNQDITTWNISGVTDLSNLFKDAIVFNQDLSAWNATVSGITNMSSLFEGTIAFNQDISAWDVSNVTNMNLMFANTPYNGNITTWNVGSVANFNSMFFNNAVFNQNISGWNVSSATDMRGMFSGASAFNQNLGGWNVSNVTLMANMLNNSGLSVDNYDNLLIGWEGQILPPNVNLGATGLFYCAGSSARQNMIANLNWFISDAGLRCISVYQGPNTTGKEIFNGQAEIIDFGSINISPGVKSLSFTIESQIASALTNFNASITTNTGTAFNLVPPPVLPTTINAGTPLTLNIELSNLTAGTFTETVSFTSDNFTGTFDFTVTGVVTATTQPEIAVFEGNTIYGNTILSGVSTFAIGIQNRGTDVINQFTITNRGSQVLVISGLSVTGTSFSLNPVTPVSIPIDGTQTITVTLDGTTGGIFSETVTINSDDADEATFNFIVDGIIEGPDITVFDGPDIYSDPRLNNGQGDIIDFASAPKGTDIIRKIAVANTGPVGLLISDIVVAAPFTIIPPSPFPFTIPPMVDGIPGVDTVTIVLSAAVAGSFNEPIAVLSDDDLKPSFDFNVVGNITDPNAPKVYWTDATNKEINRSNLDGTLFEQYRTEPMFIPLGIAIDTLNSKAYWTNNYGQIRQADIGPTGFVNVADFINDGLDAPRKIGGVSLDVAGGKIYWASSYDGSIKSADLLAASPITTIQSLVTGLEDPRSITVDPGNGKLYYTENIDGTLTTMSLYAELHQANLDGSADVTLYTLDITYESSFFNDVKVDMVNNMIYWSSTSTDLTESNRIYSASLLDVAGTATSFTTVGESLGIDLDIAAGKIYWVENEIISLKPYEIIRASFGGTSKEILQTGAPNLSAPYFLALDNLPPNAVCLNPPTVSAGGDDIICENDLVNLGATMGGGATSVLWTTSGDGSFDVAASIAAIYTPGTNDLANGSVTLTITTDDPDGTGPCVAATDASIITISQAPTVIAGPAQTTCEGSTVSLAATIGGSATSVLWTTNGDGSFDINTSLTAIYTPGTNDLLNGTATLTITTDDPDATGPCIAATDAVIITISPAPTVIAGPAQTICQGNTVSLAATMGGSTTSISWTTSGDGSFDDNTSLTAIYTPGTNDLANGTVTLTITTNDPDGTGPCIAATDASIITISPAPTVVAGAAQTICQDGVANLAATIGGSASTVLWTTNGDGTFNNDTSVSAIYTPGTNDLSNGTLTLTITTDDPDGSGTCTAATDNLVINIEQLPTTDAGADQNVCPADIIALTGTLGGSATTAIWTSNGDGAFDDPNKLAANYTPGTADAGNGTVTLTITSTANVICTPASDQMIITISSPIAAIDQSASLDVQETTTIDVMTGATINLGDIITTTLVSTPQKGSATVNADGTISYTATIGNVGADSFNFQISNQCNQTSSAQVNITINNQPPTVDVPPSDVVSGGIASINIISNITDNNGNVDLSSLRIVVQPLSGASATLDTDGNLTVDYTGLTFTGTDELTIEICDFDGLCSQEIIYIEVAPPTVIVYNAVSPNGDGKHDFLEIENAEFFPDNQVRILNRWGDIVFEISGYDNLEKIFDGRVNKSGSGELPPGTYFYSIILGNDSAEINGFFDLRR